MPTALQQAIAAIKSGDKPAGKRLLAAALQENPHEEAAWIWMSAVVDSDAQRRDCLTRALAAVLGAILKLPPLKRALASRQVKSRYLERLITRVGV